MMHKLVYTCEGELNGDNITLSHWAAAAAAKKETTLRQQYLCSGNGRVE